MTTSDLNLILPLLASLAAPYALILAAPGPNLLIVLRASLAPSFLRPVAAALGIACGAALAAAAASCSASLMLRSTGLEYVGAGAFSAILIRSALRLLFPRPDPPTASGQPTAPRRGLGVFALGLFAALSNPMSIPFFISFFVSHPTFQTGLATAFACLMVFLMATLWFGAIGLVFSTSAARNLHGRAGRAFQIGLAVLMIGCAVLSVCEVFGR